MKNDKGSWTTITPYEGATKHRLPLLDVLFFDDTQFQLNTGPWPDIPGLEQLTMRGSVESGAIVFTEMTISSSSITSDTARDLRIGDLRTALAAWLKEEPESIDIRTAGSVSSSYTEGYSQVLLQDAAEGRAGGVAASENIATTGRLAGRPTLPDELLKLVAKVYVEEFAKAPGRSFIPAMVERLEALLVRPEIPRSTVRYWIRKARQRDWLGPATRGNPNAEPGPRFREQPPEDSDD